MTVIDGKVTFEHMETKFSSYINAGLAASH